ncbi:conserved domain protein, putative [Verrucomicrobiia bacterium DG1235]|nr:conserved domain protein, putative [Verrucomicrobiae bacterium DG1235]
MTYDILAVLFLVALLAGFIDTLAGGGGLIALPALLMAGVPPLVALGTNKLQGSVGTATASWMMVKNGRVEWRDVRSLMALAFCGSAGGSVAVQFVDVSVLSLLIPIVLTSTALYFLLMPQVRERGKVLKARVGVFRGFAVPGIGWYDGMFGPGTGSFFSLAGVSLRGQGLVEATAVAKTLNFATNIASLCVFLFAGKVAWLAGGTMILGQLLGAWLGSHCLLRINPQVLRGLVVVMCLAMLAKYGGSQGWW